MRLNFLSVNKAATSDFRTLVSPETQCETAAAVTPANLAKSERECPASISSWIRSFSAIRRLSQLKQKVQLLNAYKYAKVRFMEKQKAVQLAGSAKALAELLGVSQSAVSQWSEELPQQRVWQLMVLRPEWFKIRIITDMSKKSI
jgi:hypothetical protein